MHVSNAGRIGNGAGRNARQLAGIVCAALPGVNGRFSPLALVLVMIVGLVSVIQIKAN